MLSRDTSLTIIAINHRLRQWDEQAEPTTVLTRLVCSRTVILFLCVLSQILFFVCCCWNFSQNARAHTHCVEISKLDVFLYVRDILCMKGNKELPSQQLCFVFRLLDDIR